MQSVFPGPAHTVRNMPVELDDLALFDVELPPGSGRGPLVNRPSAHQLGLIAAPAFRLYLNLTGYWDRFGTFNGRLIGPTIRKVKRNEAGYLVDARGEIVTENGKPSRRATHPRAVELFDADGAPLDHPAVLQAVPITPSSSSHSPAERAHCDCASAAPCTTNRPTPPWVLLRH